MSEHHSPIKTPKQLISAIILCFLVPIIIILLLVNYVNFDNIGAAGTDSLSAENTIKRISPIANVNYKDPNAPIIYKSGKEVYENLCVTCHASGAAGAPKFGNQNEWTSRIGQGLSGLLHSLLNGKGVMPARAGSSPDDYTDYELTKAIVYIVNSSGGNLSEPPLPSISSKATPSTLTSSAEVIASNDIKNIENNISNQVKAIDTGSTNITNLENGKKIYEQTCIACHGSGIAGAPKLGDKNAWRSRISLGNNALYTSALKGKGAMPPKGGFAGSNEDFKLAVDYIINSSK